eukprot:1377586-Amphidinium_carterae.1
MLLGHVRMAANTGPSGARTVGLRLLRKWAGLRRVIACFTDSPSTGKDKTKQNKGVKVAILCVQFCKRDGTQSQSGDRGDEKRSNQTHFPVALNHCGDRVYKSIQVSARTATQFRRIPGVRRCKRRKTHFQASYADQLCH